MFEDGNLGDVDSKVFGYSTLTNFLLGNVLTEMFNIINLNFKVEMFKIYELDYNGPFKYTLEGELEGHIAIGVQMIDRAINNLEFPFSEDFIRRIKGCIIQHHGKLEYGSPRAANMEESFILNYADTIDATMNKISQIKAKNESGKWSEYDKRIETKLYL